MLENHKFSKEGYHLHHVEEDKFDLREILALNEEFHFNVYRAAGNTALFGIINMLWLRCGPLLPHVYGFYKAVRSQPKTWIRCEDHHNALIENLERGETDRARAIIAEGIRAGLNAYRAVSIDLQVTID